MAYSVRVEAYSGPATSPMLRIEPCWWDALALMKDARFLPVEETPGYSDYRAILTVAEFKELHERFRPAIPDGRDCDAPTTRGKCLMLDGLVETLADSQFVRIEVTVFEWYSGYE